jgi:hypothetical protein
MPKIFKLKLEMGNREELMTKFEDKTFDRCTGMQQCEGVHSLNIAGQP